MQPTVYDALKEFDKRLHVSFPGATFRVIDPFEGHDVAVEVALPVKTITQYERMTIAEIAASLEEEYDVYIGILTKTIA